MADEIKQEPPAKLKVTIDNVTVEVEPGTTILQAARMVGGDVAPPAMCFYTPLKGSGGKCRTCLVEVSKGSEKDPRPMPKLVASCRTGGMDGMEVKNITSDRVIGARNGVGEFLLINHPLDCPVCDQAGECDLQDLSYNNGTSASRYEFKKRIFKKHDLGEYIQLHMTRCILCYRCVFTADQVTGKRQHGVLDRGDHSEIATYIEKSLNNDFIGNVIDVCPVGALTDKTFRFKSRVWFTKPVDAHRHCDKCCGKVTLWNRGNEVFRVTTRKDQWGEVQSFDGKTGWICNECRFDKKDVNDWVIEGLTTIPRHSVKGANKYKVLDVPKETIGEVMQRKPKLLMDIHSVSDVNSPLIDLSKIEGPATSDVFNKAKALEDKLVEEKKET
ncbi:MAG: NADH dehydrogenase [Sphingobacteriales bacterium 41-5]|nr:MAG: NADH dehydrogenase [Sphingobacteriales bacterium 41-5]